MAAHLCECGCGEAPGPGNRFVHGHYPRTLRQARPETPNDGRCPRCGRSVVFKADGTPGVHWATSARAAIRIRCSAGGVPAPPRTHRRRRVTVSVDVVLPAGWDMPRFKTEAAAVLRAHLDGAFIVSADVTDDDEVAS